MTTLCECIDCFSFFYVLFDDRIDDCCRIVKIGNKNYPLRPLIGCPFGSLFQVENGANGPSLARITSTAEGSFTFFCLYLFIVYFFPSHRSISMKLDIFYQLHWFSLFFFSFLSDNNAEDKKECDIKEESRDNRALIDNNTAQTLTGEDIEGMRRLEPVLWLSSPYKMTLLPLSPSISFNISICWKNPIDEKLHQVPFILGTKKGKKNMKLLDHIHKKW